MSNQAISQSLLSLSVEQVTFGGERVSHLYPNDCYFAHLSIYHFATQFCQDGVVLDAGSGAGYGSFYLAEHAARSVTAVDISEQGVAFSQHYFKRSNLHYQPMDLQAITGFPTRHFDLIFSSNALEHVPNVIAFFRSAWNLLKPEGTMVIAVPPVVDQISRQANLDNPYHLNIWSPRQWSHVLSQFFYDVQSYRHGFDKPGISLDFGNTPQQTVVTEKDFVFEPIFLEQFFRAYTLTVLFVVRRPRSTNELPAPKNSVTFVDDSFTRPLILPSKATAQGVLGTSAAPFPRTPWWQLPGRAWMIAREQGWRVLAQKILMLFSTRLQK